MIFHKGKRATTVLLWYRKWCFSKENLLQRCFYDAVNDFSQRKTCSDGTFMVPTMIFLKEKPAPTVLLWWREWFFSKKIVLLMQKWMPPVERTCKHIQENGIVCYVFWSQNLTAPNTLPLCGQTINTLLCKRHCGIFVAWKWMKLYFYGTANDFCRKKTCSDGTFMASKWFFSKEIVFRRYFYGAANDFGQRKRAPTVLNN